jgi:hypothetical protein
MTSKQNTSAQEQGARAPYEAPAIEESAAFERLALMCSMSPDEAKAGTGCLPITSANSSP